MGGLAHGDPNQDPQPALIALGASAVLASKTGTREVAVEDLSSGYYETVISPNEVLTEVVVPVLATSAGHAFIKFLPRTADDYATVSVAVLLSLDSNGNCRDVRITLGSCGVTPVRAHQAEAILEGRAPTPQRLRHAAETVAAEVDPSDDVRGSAEYKREMAPVMNPARTGAGVGAGSRLRYFTCHPESRCIGTKGLGRKGEHPLPSFLYLVAGGLWVRQTDRSGRRMTGGAQHTLALSSRGRGDLAADGLVMPAHPPSDCRPYSRLAPPVPGYFARYIVRKA